MRCLTGSSNCSDQSNASLEEVYRSNNHSIRSIKKKTPSLWEIGAS